MLRPHVRFCRARILTDHFLMTSVVLHRSAAGDLPVFFLTDSPLPFTGSLVFGVGRQDETARTAGIGHLVEHLVMKRVGRVETAHNAVTDDDNITFYATGSPGQVVDFLNRVAAAISTLDHLDDAEVARQRKTILAELGEGDEKTGRGPLLDRYGVQDVGLLDFRQPAHRTHTRDMALRFATTWLHAGNAALTFNGAVPEGLDVRLPTGRPRPHTDPPTPVRTGGWVTNPFCGVTLSMIVEEPWEVRNLLGAVAAESLMDDLRHDAGLIYSVGGGSFVVGPERRVITFALDPHEDDVDSTVRGAVATIRRLAAHGPSAEVTRRVTESLANDLADPNTQLVVLHTAAVAILRGDRDPSDLTVGAPADISPEVLREAFARAEPTLLVSANTDSLTPETAAAIALADTNRSSELQSMGKVALARHLMRSDTDIYSRRFRTGLRGAQLVIDNRRVAIIHEEDIVEVLFDEVIVAGVCTDCGHWDFTDTHGDGFLFFPESWRGADKIVRRLEERIPLDRRYALSEDAEP